MKGVSYIVDEKNYRKAVIIEIGVLKRHSNNLQDFLDGIIAESRKEDTKVPLKKVINKLKKTNLL